MNTKRGITLLTLSISIIIMIILLTVTVINGSDMYINAQKTKLQSEIDQLEILTNNYITRSSGIPFEEVEIDISQYSPKEKLQFDGETVIDNKIKLYVVDLAAIDAEEVAYGTQKNGTQDRYLYSSVTKRIYYEQGIMIDETKYHRVNETGDN